MKLKKCPACSKEVSPKAKICPNCGHPLENFWTKKRSSFWFIAFIAIIIGYFIGNVPDVKTNNTYEKTSFNKEKTTSVNTFEITNKKLTKKDKQKILQIVKSEKSVKDAIFMGDVLYVGVYDNGSRRDGYAEYLCLSINQAIKLPYQIYIKIVDYKDILQKKGFKEIGKYFCPPMKFEKVKSVNDI